MGPLWRTGFREELPVGSPSGALVLLNNFYTDPEGKYDIEIWLPMEPL